MSDFPDRNRRRPGTSITGDDFPDRNWRRPGTSITGDDFPDRNWRRPGESATEEADEEGARSYYGQTDFDSEDEDDHLDRSLCGSGEVETMEGYNYDIKNLTPRTDKSGGLIYSSFIPPLPKRPLPRLYSYFQPEPIEESPEELASRVSEILKNTKLYINTNYSSPGQNFPAKYIGLTFGGYIVLKFLDTASQGQYKLVQENLRMYFVKKSETRMPLEEIDHGRLVLAKWEEGKYVRAQVTRVDKATKMVQIKDCDEWNYKTIPSDDIFYIIPPFLNTPFMATRCKLKGLELWFKTGVLNELLPLTSEFYEDVRVTDFERAPDNIPIVTVKIQSKNKNEKETTLNGMYLRVIRGFTRVPRHFFRGNILERAHITVAEFDATVWVQMHSEITSKLTSIGKNPEHRLCSDEFNFSDPPMSDFEYSYFERKDRRFLARFHDDKNFYRVQVLEANRDESTVKVQYLEFGNIEVINVEDIIPTALVDPTLTLNLTPMQVFKGTLSGIESIVDGDQFFETMGMVNLQRIAVTTTDDPGNNPILDVFATLDSTKPHEWTYINQLMLDKGIATGPGIPKSSICGTPIIPKYRDTVPTKKEHMRQKSATNKRYLESCRIIEDAVIN